MTRGMRKRFFETNLKLTFSNIKSFITDDSTGTLTFFEFIETIIACKVLRTLNKLQADDCILLASIVEEYGCKR